MKQDWKVCFIDIKLIRNEDKNDNICLHTGDDTRVYINIWCVR